MQCDAMQVTSLQARLEHLGAQHEQAAMVTLEESRAMVQATEMARETFVCWICVLMCVCVHGS